jgi:AAA+ superfamily predicted ATPase
MALVEARNDPSAVFDDVIMGKGRGLNILLQYVPSRFFMSIALICESGQPGLGKTLTAEAVAEFLKRPLYSVCSAALRLLSLI